MFYDDILYVIKVTDDCFMRCPYCMVDEEFDKTEMSHETFRNILYKSVGMNKVTISFVGGEPLMVGMEWYKKAFEIARDFSEEHLIKVEYQMFTNGVLLNDEWMELLESNGVGIIMSYDGKDRGPKGRKKSQKIAEKYGSRFVSVNIVLNSSNYNDLIEIFTELESYGVKRVMNYTNIYEQNMALEFADGLIKLFKHIDENPSKTKFMTYEDIKRVIKTNNLGRITNGTIGKVFMNNSFVVHTNGLIKACLCQTEGPEWEYGNINEIEHIVDAVFSENNIRHNKEFVKTLNYIGPNALENTMTRGGGFFFDKGAIGMRMDVPNLLMLPFYKKLFDHVRGKHAKS